MKFFRLALSAFLFATLIACGGDDDDGSVAGDVSDAGDAGDAGDADGDGADDASLVALQAISGVWDSSDFDGGQQDVIFSVIRADGSATDYDYLGDEFDNSEDCYLRIDFNFIHEGDSRFSVTSSEFEDDDTVFDISVQDGNLVTLLIGTDETENFPPAGLTEADFTPLCDSSFQ